jgi:hypothetical protein
MTRPIVTWTLALCLFVLATNRYEAAPGPESMPSDAYEYFVMAQSAPGVPQSPLLFHHAQRIGVPFLIGTLHGATGIPLHILFLAGIVLLELVILLLAGLSLAALSVQPAQIAIVIGMLALNPWAFRFYLTFPEMIPDVAFVAGVALMLWGLITRRALPIIAGQTVASVSRQTALLVVPVVIIWLWRRDNDWKHVLPYKRMALCISTTAVAVAIYLVTAQVAARISTADTNLEHLIGVVPWVATQFSLTALLTFLIRTAMSLAIPLAMLAAALRSSRESDGPVAIPALLAATVFIAVQPLLAGPEVTGGNGPRLVTLGLLPLAMAAGVALHRARAFDAARLSRLGGMVGFLTLASLHHWFVLAAVPTTSTRVFFGAAYAAACVGCFSLASLEARAA